MLLFISRLIYTLLFISFPVHGAIKIVKDSSQIAKGNVGEAVVLKCRVNQYWEYCTWKHVSRGNSCNFEWKYSTGKVVRQQCPSLWSRAKFGGDYDKYECNLKIDVLEEKDFGQWTCIVEDYVLFGGRGAVVKGYVDLEKDDGGNFTTPYESLTTTTEEVSSNLSWGDLATRRTTTISRNKTYEVKAERAPKSLSTSEGSSNAFLAVGLIIGLMFLLFFIAVGTLYYRRRRKSEREFEWLTNKKKNIPITEVVPEDQYDPEQNCLDINPSTQRVTYLDESKKNSNSFIEPPQLRLF
uniref:Ig-like domain-containing protein n=1 Tax=Lepeophtheirus salmonis TaxID=72036 RepID=A0A0K2UW75_LEPSM